MGGRGALGFGDYVDAGLPVENPYTTQVELALCGIQLYRYIHHALQTCAIEGCLPLKVARRCQLAMAVLVWERQAFNLCSAVCTEHISFRIRPGA
jgi:hypothetical protein